MTSGDMTKERLESDWGITCEIVTSSQGSDNKVNRDQVEEKIGDKLRAGYEKKITEKLDIVDSNWWQKFIIYLTPLGGFKETILKKNPVNNTQLEEMSNNLIQLCLQNERNQDKTEIKNDQVIVVTPHDPNKNKTQDKNSTKTQNQEIKNDIDMPEL